MASGQSDESLTMISIGSACNSYQRVPYAMLILSIIALGIENVRKYYREIDLISDSSLNPVAVLLFLVRLLYIYACNFSLLFHYNSHSAAYSKYFLDIPRRENVLCK